MSLDVWPLVIADVRDNQMKKIDKLAMTLIVLWIISIPASQYLAGFIIPTYVDNQELRHFHVLTRCLAYAQFLIDKLVDIAIAIWLYTTAKKNFETPWLWALLGLVGGVFAALLYYVKQIYDRPESKENQPREPSDAPAASVGM